MTGGPDVGPSRRADARRNRALILHAAREVFTGTGHGGAAVATARPEQSMAEVARRAGVGRGTLYRNFPSRRDLLEALFADEVDGVVAAAVPSDDDPAEALLAWLHRFAAFEDSKHAIAGELLDHTDHSDPMFSNGRRRVVAAGEPLLTRAQQAGQIRADATVAQALDLVLAVARLDRDRQELAQILRIALDGLRATPPAAASARSDNGPTSVSRGR